MIPGLMVCATNLDSELDPAIWRRFDEILEVPKPGRDEIRGCRDALKRVVLEGQETVTEKILLEALAESGGRISE